MMDVGTVAAAVGLLACTVGTFAYIYGVEVGRRIEANFIADALHEASWRLSRGTPPPSRDD